MTALEFGYTIESLTPSLKPFAMRLTKDHEDANDLLQETIVKAFTHREKFEEGTNLKAWMYTIMKNTFITNYQRMVRRKTFIDTTENLHFINSTDSQISNEALNQFTMKDITEAVDKLKDAFKVPFLMHFQGYKYNEISEHLNIPIGTVKNRIHVARKELKSNLSIYSHKN
jgi:RNA polymerase sigma factor (sigma-70 family)